MAAHGALWDELPAPGHTGADAREAARDVLARPEFHRPGPSLIERVERWVSDAIGRVLDAISGAAGGGLVASLILIGAVVLATVMIVRFSRGVQADAARPAARVITGRGRDAEGWRALAEEAEAHGLWREALRCRYRALVAELAGNGVLEDIPGKTTGEERADIARAVPAASAAFSDATTLFDDVWYGDAHVGRDEAAKLDELARSVLAEVER